MKRDKIFISHCTPSDNYFTTWLASKLKLLGYDVWVELDELKLGDPFWPEIEDAIRNKSVKFLMVISKAYLDRVKTSSSGIFKELSCADSIKDLGNFKSPLRIDDVSFDDFPVQIMGLNALDFYGNWQEGLEKLLDSFIKEKITPDPSKSEDFLNFWLNAFKIKDIVNNKSEKVFTNWFPFTLPDKLYIHKPIVQSKLDLIDILFPYITYNDRHVSFFSKNDYPASIQCSSSIELNIEEIIEEKAVLVDDFLTLLEPRRKIIELLNKAFREFLIQKGLTKYEQANAEVFYFKSTPENRRRVSLKLANKTNVSITGKKGRNVWSYGISHFAALHPFPNFKIASHIIFEGFDLIALNQEEQKTLRKSFAFDWYNKDWLDTMLGMMIKIAGEHENQLLIPINSSSYLQVETLPYSMETDFGYFEPHVKEEKDAD